MAGILAATIFGLTGNFTLYDGDGKPIARNPAGPYRRPQ
jgi:hypothetical protein